MDEPAFAFMKQLIETPSPSGYEEPAQAVAAERLKALGAKLTVDVHGNLIDPWALWMVMVVGIVYETVAVAAWGRTLGKWTFGLRVARYTSARPTPPVSSSAALSLRG